MFDNIFSSFLLHLFHTMSSVLFIILHCGPFSFTSAPSCLHLQITLSPLLSLCYHCRRHHSFPSTHLRPHPRLSRFFLGSLLAPLFLAFQTSVFFHLSLSWHGLLLLSITFSFLLKQLHLPPPSSFIQYFRPFYCSSHFLCFLHFPSTLFFWIQTSPP